MFFVHCNRSGRFRMLLWKIHLILTLLLKPTPIDSCLECSTSIYDSMGLILDTLVSRTLEIHGLFIQYPKMRSKIVYYPLLTTNTIEYFF